VNKGASRGKFYTAKDCDSMLLQNEGLNEARVGELRMATSTLQEGDVARDRAAGQGARLLRGEEHKDCDTAVRLEKEVTKNDFKVQKEEAAKDAAARTVAESGVMVYRHCSKSFVRQKCFRSHQEVCVEELASRACLASSGGSCSRPGAFGCKSEHWTGELFQGSREQGDVLPYEYYILSNTARSSSCQGRMGVQRGGWGQRWGLQEVPLGFSADTVQQQWGAKN
jgi:hypothetical protein